ncbi:Uncharacterised protein [Vibrio cholerae]|nr:Uncharacterised protein [Vibrio cholerae]CSC67976.1 Uncharacterised protein [Vibrio cholerae]
MKTVFINTITPILIQTKQVMKAHGQRIQLVIPRLTKPIAQLRLPTGCKLPFKT